MGRVLVTGGTGFLGRYIVNSIGKLNCLSVGRSSENDIICDLSKFIPDVPSDVEALVHCAGLAHDLSGAYSEKDYFDSHVNGLKNILDMATRHNINKVILISSVAVYGLEGGVEIDENVELRPISAYGRAKLEAEGVLRGWAAGSSRCYCTFRLPLVVGEDAPGNLGALSQSIKERRYYYIESVNPRKSVVFADDIAAFIREHLGRMHPSMNGEFNVTSGNPSNLKDITDYLIKKYNPIYDPMTVPFWAAKALALLGDYISILPVNSMKLSKLSRDLTFSDRLARDRIKWISRNWGDLI